MAEFNDWNVTTPGIIALSHTQYEIRHQNVGGTWYFNIYWRGECVRACHMTLDSAKREVLSHMSEMIQMGLSDSQNSA